jgi:site-specific recombinase XerD
VNIRDAVSAFFSEFHFPESSGNTKRTYQTAMKNFLQYIHELEWDRKSVSSLSPSIISQYGAWVIHNGKTEPTQNIYESALRRAINFWRLKGWIEFTNEEEKAARVAMRIQSKKKPTSLSSRVGRVPEDFGDKMLSVAASEAQLSGVNRLSRLNSLRSIALIHLLRATGLRIGDACRLTKSDIRNASARDGYFTLSMQKTGSLAHCFLGGPALRAIEDYLQERSDSSPWIFIQHARTGKARPGTTQFFRTVRRGYGARISTKTAWEIIRKIGRRAYGKTSLYLSPHAFRHWHAQSLIRAGARLEDVQSVLGHANPVITKQIYAPEPDISRISEKEKLIQETESKNARSGAAVED